MGSSRPLELSLIHILNRELAAGLNVELREVLEPLLKEIESLNERVKEYDERMEKIATEVYPQVSLLKQVKGVGTVSYTHLDVYKRQEELGSSTFP